MNHRTVIALLILAVAGCATPDKPVVILPPMPPMFPVERIEAAEAPMLDPVVLRLRWEDARTFALYAVEASEDLQNWRQVEKVTEKQTWVHAWRPHEFYRVQRLPGTVVLEWDHNPDNGILEYRLYYGPRPDVDRRMVSTEDLTAPVHELVADQTYWFYVTAVNVFGLESNPSETITYTLPEEDVVWPRITITR